uniref:Histone deacetylase domain-containing protein n=1 Tax=Chrysocystis fragilis TaxID=1411660 RepID=A0A7S0TCT3_9STRA|mmetsp:Transcript_124/g.323  ORF Transcript_124/g.323 Transcript_124/m.323 type:complete len:354 (+) Transcript_124:22-1083(+)
MTAKRIAAASREFLSFVHHPGYESRSGGKVMEALRVGGLLERGRVAVPRGDEAEGVRARSRGEWLEAAGTVLAAQLAVETQGVACSLGGGMGREAADPRPNDAAAAASTLLARGKVRRVLLVDLGARRADGTASALAREPRAPTMSLHARSGRSAASTVDVCLDPSAPDADYLGVLARHLPRLLDRHRPDLVLFAAPLDVSTARDDAPLRLSDDGLRRRDAFVLAETFLRRSIPVATVFGDCPADDHVRRRAIHALAAADVVLAATSPAASALHLGGRPGIADLLQPWAHDAPGPPPRCADFLLEPPPTDALCRDGFSSAPAPLDADDDDDDVVGDITSRRGRGGGAGPARLT